MQIFVDYERTATISAPASLLKRLGLGLLRKGILHFGSRTCYVNIAERAEHTDDGIWISSDLMESLLVPVELPFEIRIVNHDMFLGPVIGVLVSSRSKSITPRRRRVTGTVPTLDTSKRKKFGFQARAWDGQQKKKHPFNADRNGWTPRRETPSKANLVKANDFMALAG